MGDTKTNNSHAVESVLVSGAFRMWQEQRRHSLLTLQGTNYSRAGGLKGMQPTMSGKGLKRHRIPGEGTACAKAWRCESPHLGTCGHGLQPRHLHPLPAYPDSSSPPSLPTCTPATWASCCLCTFRAVQSGPWHLLSLCLKCSPPLYPLNSLTTCFAQFSPPTGSLPQPPGPCPASCFLQHLPPAQMTSLWESC